MSEGTKRSTIVGMVIGLLLLVYGVWTVINWQMSFEHIGTYIYGNALILFLFTGLPAIIIGLVVAILAYRRR